MNALPAIRVSRFDLDRLEPFLHIYGARAEALADELARAEILEPAKVPPDLVTMNSRVRIMDEETGEETEITLVFPSGGERAGDDVSVLAPMGSALLGLSVGDRIEWPVPTGRTRRIRVTAIPFQPEAAGRLDL